MTQVELIPRVAHIMYPNEPAVDTATRTIISFMLTRLMGEYYTVQPVPYYDEPLYTVLTFFRAGRLNNEDIGALLAAMHGEQDVYGSHLHYACYKAMSELDGVPVECREGWAGTAEYYKERGKLQ